MLMYYQHVQIDGNRWEKLKKNNQKQCQRKTQSTVEYNKAHQWASEASVPCPWQFSWSPAFRVWALSHRNWKVEGRNVYSIPLLHLAGMNHWQHTTVICKKAFIDVIGCLIPLYIANCKSSESSQALFIGYWLVSTNDASLKFVWGLHGQQGWELELRDSSQNHVNPFFIFYFLLTHKDLGHMCQRYGQTLESGAPDMESTEFW